MLTSTYSTLLNPLVSLFSTTLSSLNTLIKRSIGKYTLLALAAYSSLSRQQARWNDVIAKRSGRGDSELKDGINSIRASCLRSFPEFLVDLKAAAAEKTGELSVNIVGVTAKVRGRCTCLCSQTLIRDHGHDRRYNTWNDW